MASTIAFISPNFDFDTRRAIGQSLIDYIRRRAKAGRGANNQPMGGPDGDNRYSPNYTKTPEFKAAGKSKGRVNMTLTGDLLDDLVILDASVAGRIEIGPEQTENKNKATWLREKGYDFLTLTQDEVNTVVRRFDKSQVPSVNISQSLAQSILRGILGGG